MSMRAETADTLRRRLAGKTGGAFWRSLEELDSEPSFRTFLEAEFPALAPAAAVDRRAMLKLMGASLALAGLTGCGFSEDETAMPYVEQPVNVEPGIPKWYATAVTLAGYAQPVLGKTHAGRPVKLEGNPGHAASLGATDAFTQAALLGLYDPDRSGAPRYLGRPSDWAAFDRAMTDHARTLDRSGGAGFRLLSGQTTSPTLLRQIDELLRRWPNARWHVHEPANEDLRLEAARLVFGRPLDRLLMLDAAEAVVSLDDDILGAGPRQTLHARRWSKRRQAAQAGAGDSLLFAAEPTPSLTGIAAGSRLIAGAGRIADLLAALKSVLEGGAPAGLANEPERRWIESAGRALDAHRGRALVTIGSAYPPELQAMTLLLNETLGAFGKTLRFTAPIARPAPDGLRSFGLLADDMKAGRVTTLAVLECNPAFTSSGDCPFAALMETVALRLHAGLHYDETAALSHWHTPTQHALESWSDARAVDGMASLIQPLVRPYLSVRSPHTLLANWGGHAIGDREAVEATWRPSWGADFDARRGEALLKGFIPGSALPDEVPVVSERAFAAPIAGTAGLQLVIRPDPSVWDGRFGANGWLQELPKPISKLTWGNAFFIAPQLAREHGLKNGDELRVNAEGREATGPVFIVPGQDAGAVVITLGYGAGRLGEMAGDLGVDAYRLRSTGEPWHLPISIEPTRKSLPLATTQPSHAIDGFDFIRTVPRADPALRAQAVQNPSFYPPQQWSDPSWGMSIDLDLCIGCNACMTACQAENNVPVVGKQLVAEGREMHWLRVDHYHRGDADDPDMYFQPVPCMHCEDAPCEMGCPVNAAVHSFDGLNLQVYNRCIGTRTCSSYCPYKVRRFNWFDFTKDDAEPIKAMRNPDVTVRQRGVMEKCTYCVQRIDVARIDAKKEGRALRDGEVRTACQQACPTSAIVFGNILDKGSEVSRRKQSGRDYALLEEVNTRPRTTYLAPILDGPTGDASG